MTKHRVLAWVVSVCACLTAGGRAGAALHTYVIAEVFSSVDGKVQFVELREASNAPGQSIFSAGALVARNADGSESRTFDFPADLPSTDTANTRVLIATAAFAALPNAPTPDYIMPDGFLYLGSGSIQFTGNFIGEVAYAGLPTDGVTALVLPAGTPATNSPKNFNMGGMTGEAGSVTAPPGACCVGTLCSQTVQGNCAGTWTMSAPCSSSSCVPPPVTGRCCRGATCAILEQSACTGPVGVGSAFGAGATECNAAGALTAPCCLADVDKTGGVQIDDLFLYLNLWFTNSPFADVGGNGQVGPSIDDLFLYFNAYFTGGC